MRCRLAAVLALALSLALPAHADALRKRAGAAAMPSVHGQALTVGSVTLGPCGPAWCGQLLRALDPSGEVPGTIAIGFEFYPQRDAARPNAGAIVATEGGPGYATSGPSWIKSAHFRMPNAPRR